MRKKARPSCKSLPFPGNSTRSIRNNGKYNQESLWRAIPAWYNFEPEANLRVAERNAGYPNG